MADRTVQTDETLIEAAGKAALVGLIYFCAASFSLTLSRGPYGFAPLWPANAILLAAVLRGWRPSRRYLVAGMIASLAANRWAGGSWLVCIGFTAANLLEPLLARMMLRAAFPLRVVSQISGRTLMVLCTAAGIAAAVSGLVATLFVPGERLSFFVSWFLADMLGMLIVTPIAVMAVDAMGQKADQRFPSLPRVRAIETAALLGMVTVVTLAVFLQSEYPLLFVPLAVMMATVVRLGTIGASFSILVIAAIASVATSLGSGPVAMIGAGRLGEAFYLQGYLVTLYAAALPIAALLGAQRRLVEELSESVRLLNLAEAAAQLGHWRFTPGDGKAFWSDQTFRIYGLPVTKAPPLDNAIDAFIEEDRELVRTLFERALSDGQRYEFRARLRRADTGVIRDIMSRAEIDRGSDGEIVAVFGMLQDITAHSEQERALVHARNAAEEAAAVALRASETDSLTGLPNRRQLLSVLERAHEQATDQGQGLSVAILDIDHFKQVNDLFGHVVGDHVLQRVAQAAVGALRGTDLIGRYGGEEFIIVLPQASLDVAETIAERVRAGISAAGGFGELEAVTASLGVACWRRGESLTRLLERADEALYQAKRSGRNRVCIAASRVDVD